MPLDFLKSPAAQLAAKVLGGGAIGAGVLGGLGEFNNNDQDPARRAAQRKRNLLLGAALGGLGGGALAGYDKLVKPELNKTPPPENPYLDHSYYNGVKNLGDFPITAGAVAGVGANAVQNSRITQNLSLKNNKPNFFVPNVTNPGVLPVSPYISRPAPVHPGPVPTVQPLPHNLPPGAPMPITFTPQAIVRAQQETARAQAAVDAAYAKAVESHAISEAKGIADHAANAAKLQADSVAKVNAALEAQTKAMAEARASVVSMTGGVSRGTEGWKHMYDQMSIHADELAAFAEKEFSHLPAAARIPAAKAHVKKMMEMATANTSAAKVVEHALSGQMGNFSGPLISRKLITDPRHLLGHSAAYWRGSPRARILATAAGAAGLTETAGRALKTNSPLERWHLGGDKLDAFLEHQKAQAPTTSPTSSDSRFKLEIK